MPRGAPRPAPACDLLVVGLGNPGERYEGTRHNIGATAVTRLAERHGARLRPDPKVRASLAEVRLDGRRVVLAVPMTYMNESGQAVGALVRRYGVGPDQLLVVHDELDLEPGRLKLKVGGGLAGHNGLRSVEAHLHHRDFLRLRLGVGKPPGGPERGADWVLARVPAGRRRELEELADRAGDAVEAVAVDGVERATQRLHASP